MRASPLASIVTGMIIIVVGIGLLVLVVPREVDVPVTVLHEIKSPNEDGGTREKSGLGSREEYTDLKDKGDSRVLDSLGANDDVLTNVKRVGDAPEGELGALRSKLITCGFGPERKPEKWVRKDYIQLNELMRSTVFEVLGRTLDFAQVQAELGQLVRMQAVPDAQAVGIEDATIQEREGLFPNHGQVDFTQSLSSEDSRMPSIVYKSIEIPGHGTLYAFQNSFWRYVGHGYVRERGDPYAVLVDGGVVWSGVVIKPLVDSGESLSDGKVLVVSRPRWNWTSPMARMCRPSMRRSHEEAAEAFCGGG